MLATTGCSHNMNPSMTSRHELILCCRVPPCKYQSYKSNRMLFHIKIHWNLVYVDFTGSQLFLISQIPDKQNIVCFLVKSESYERNTPGISLLWLITFITLKLVLLGLHFKVICLSVVFYCNMNKMRIEEVIVPWLWTSYSNCGKNLITCRMYVIKLNVNISNIHVLRARLPQR